VSNERASAGDVRLSPGVDDGVKTLYYTPIARESLVHLPEGTIVNRNSMTANIAPAKGRCAFVCVAKAFGASRGGRSNAAHLAWSPLKRARGEAVPPGEGSA
jgi:hypothetical protein